MGSGRWFKGGDFFVFEAIAMIHCFGAMIHACGAMIRELGAMIHELGDVIHVVGPMIHVPLAMSPFMVWGSRLVGSEP